MTAYVVFQRMEGGGDEREAVVIGSVRLVDGVARFSDPWIERRVTAREVRHRRWPDRVLTPADGELYLRALPQTFTDESFFAMKVYEDEDK